MKLIIGLGNVGTQYEKTRHNIGFMVLDELAKEFTCELKEKTKLKAMLGLAQVGETKLVLAKPTTMMNESGNAVRSIMDFYRINPTDLIVIHDELDILFGTVKTKRGGSDGTHNGLASITQYLSPEFWRVRVGIDQPRPRDIAVPADFVLARFNKNEEQQLNKVVAMAAESVSTLLRA